MSYANNNSTDQLAHPRSLISAFVVHCLTSIISLDSIAEISRLQLASVAAQADLCLAWSETPEDTFCRVMAHVKQKMLFGTLFENNQPCNSSGYQRYLFCNPIRKPMPD